MNLPEEIALDLLQIKAIKIQPKNPFTWASGIVSPVYCDNRLALAHPILRSKIIKGFADLVSTTNEVDIVAGVATAGIAHAALLADQLGLPMCYVRGKAKSHGRQNLIEGSIESASRAVVIEDLISTGGSSILAAKALENNGIEVSTILAIFSYGFPMAAKNFEVAGYHHNTITNLNTLLQVARSSSYLDPEEIETVHNWALNYN